MSGLYLHIPFCRQACSYCDFYFQTRRGQMGAFVDALCRDVKELVRLIPGGEALETIYLGGGTPSLLSPDELNRIMGTIHDSFRADLLEVTMELNPDDLSGEYLRGIRSAGVTRASLGVQSFDPGLLRFMHRAHSRKQAQEALSMVADAGFQSWTADLIYGNPGQSLAAMLEDLEQLLEFGPPHISAYSLTIEPRTRLGKQLELGRLEPPPEERVAEQAERLAERLSEAGIQRYEVSNFARPGHEAVHNRRYWEHRNYLGAGPSAHSFVREPEGGRRWWVAPNLERYLNEPAATLRDGEEHLRPETLAEERLMLGLRTRWGVGRETLEQEYEYRFSPDQEQWIDRAQQEGLLTDRERTVQLTDQGLLIADHLIVELLSRRRETPSAAP